MKQFFTLTLCFLAASSFAQIVNGGFESWVQNGQNCMGPESWGTINGSTGIVGVCTVEQETADVHSGSSALKLSTKQVVIPPVINEVAPGICTNGTVNTQTESVEGGDAFTFQPAAISFWYKASPVNQDEYSFSALLIDEVSGDTVGFAEAADTAIVSAYTELVVPITYVSTVAPTLLQIIFLPSSPNDPQVGSTLWIDDVATVGDVSGLTEVDNSSIMAFPNPSNGDVQFVLGNQDDATVSIFDLLGTKIHEARLTNLNSSLDLRFLSNGTYIWQMHTASGDFLKSERLVLTK